MIGKTISQYKILAKLGEGGMGVVYKAEDTKLERTVALKFLPRQIAASGEQHERFKTEAKAAAALNHPNITTIYNIEEVDDEIFIVMEYIEGKELREIVGANGRSPLPMDEILTYADQIAQGLQAAHDKGIVHRDIKSSNVMVTEKGQVKIMDFGVAKFAGVAGPTTHGSTIGTMGYMSPEQIQGQAVDHRSDLWSFGVLFYEMLTGQLPFTGEYEAAIIYEILSEEPKAIQLYRQDVPNNITALVSRLLQREIGKRVSSAKEIIENLNVKTAKETPEDDRKSIKTGWIKWAAAVSVIVVIGILAVQFFSPKKQVPQDIGAIPGMTENSSPLPRAPQKPKPSDQSPNQATIAMTEKSRAEKVATTVTADRQARESLATSELNKKDSLSLLSQEQPTDTIDVFKETGQLSPAPARETNVSSEDYATEAKALQDSLRRIKTTLDDEYIFLAEYKEAAEVERSGDALFKSGDHIGATQSYEKAAQLYEAVTRVRERQVGQVQTVIETYEKALENKDLRLLKSLYVDFTQKMLTEWDRVFKATDDIEAQLSIEGLAFQQEKVIASVDARLKYSGFVDSDNRFMWQIQLIETSSGWLIADISQNK